MESIKHKKIETIAEAEIFLHAIPQFSGEETGFKYGIDRARLLLEYMGNPEGELKIIHVAGSNGKGSVCALLDTALRASGFKTGLFTSPHLKNIRERIRFCGKSIGEDDFVRLLNEVIAACEKLREKYTGFSPAYFEYFFVISMLYFHEEGADAVLLETGMGGRLDATNAVEKPVLCIITPVSLEHTQLLGNTIEEIAAEKAGIMKPGVPALVTDENKEALQVFKDQAEAAGSSLHIFKKSSVSVNVITDEKIDFSLHNEYYRNVTVSLPIPAVYEAENAGLALTALGVMFDSVVYPVEAGNLKDSVSPCVKLPVVLKDIIKAFSGFKWPGRMERIGDGIYADGAHNVDGIKAFTASVVIFAQGKENVLLFAVSDDKDKEEMVRILCDSGLFASVVVTAFSGVRSAQIQKVAGLFKTAGHVNVFTAADVQTAYEKAISLPHDYVFCAGSLYLVGELDIS